MSSSTFMDKARKAVITGAIAGTASALVFGQSGGSTILGFELPTNVAVGVANGASSMAADYAHDYILPAIPGQAKWANLESAALGLGVSGAGTAWILNSENIGSESTMNAFLLGAGSYAAGDWVDSKVFGGQRAISYY